MFCVSAHKVEVGWGCRRLAGPCLYPHLCPRHLLRSPSEFPGSGSHSLPRLRPEPGDVRLGRGQHPSLPFPTSQQCGFPCRQGLGCASPHHIPRSSAPSLPLLSPQLPADSTCRHLTKAARRKMTLLSTPFYVPAVLGPEQRTLPGTS